jgi:IclR family transcriptional regulator, KDG regulon repressor
MVAARSMRVNRSSSAGEGSLGKGLAILQALAQAEAPRGISELARELAMPKSAVHRLLRLLMEGGWVRQDAAWRYAPTLKIWELGTRVAERIDLRQVAAPVMQDLLAATRETVYLSVLEGLEVLVVDKLESPDAVVSHARLGTRGPAHASASGKALLAGMEERELARLPTKLQRFTAHTRASRAELLSELRTVRSKGFAINRGEWHADIGGIASPVRDARGAVIASLGIHMLAAHLTAQRIREHGSVVAAHARRLTQDLGGSKTLPQEESA